MIGVAVLGQFDWRALRLGRGEWETLISAVFFTAQILWLEKPAFRGNHAGRVTLAMFVVVAAVNAPVSQKRRWPWRTRSARLRRLPFVRQRAPLTRPWARRSATASSSRTTPGGGPFKVTTAAKA